MLKNIFSQMASQDGPATRTRGQQADGELLLSRFSDVGCPLILQNSENITREDCPKAIRLPFRPADEDDPICAVCSQPAGEDAEILSMDIESRMWLNSFVFKVGDGFSLFWDRASQGFQN